MLGDISGKIAATLPLLPYTGKGAQCRWIYEAATGVATVDTTERKFIPALRALGHVQTFRLSKGTMKF